MKSITILGAGLVGSLLAIYLAKRGYKIDVFERRGDMREEKMIAGRSINLALSDRGWKGLHGVGLENEIRKIAIPMHARYVHNENGSVSKQPYGKQGQAIYSVSRGELNKKLMTLAAEHGNVKFHFNHFCNHVDLKNKTLSFSSGPADTRQLSTADYEILFGADGAFSSLRYSMQFLDRFDYSQHYIEHGYKELTIPAGENEQPGKDGGEWRMEKNFLHIWPRHSFMLIALPNLDGSFTCTLFFPFEGEASFSSLKNENDVEHFFSKYFPDAIPLMPAYKKDFFSNPTSSLVYIKCFPWSYENTACLIGDAAHGIVPFFGQGMNAGFEDCTVLNDLMDEHQDDWKKIFPAFEQSRKPNADAICDLALNNFIEMRDLVADPHFLQKKKIEKMIAGKYPNYISPYQMVSFSNIPYAEAMLKGRKINSLLEELIRMESLEGKFHSKEIEDKIEPILFG
ncbi:MAG TPA: NAD(P)/FAD-dependent oxidoreductase [Chitinophagales bacterium]|nr:NAD(P)/FAD-dependent oxidoreductase [Chitinophagales bacterium]